MKRAVALGALVIMLLTVARAAQAEPAHPEPLGPATALFPNDFPKLVDHEWNFALGGFGGIKAGAPRKHAPVIFIHGNNVDADDWYVVRDDFKAAGWSDQELWAVSYNGKGGNNGFALNRLQPERDADHASNGGVGAITNNTVNVPDVFDFIQAVRRYTGSTRFSLVGHSLGVTVGRKVLKTHPELRPDLIAFVGIAGGNHGTSFCPPGSEGNVVSCDEIAAGTPWLAELNGPDGSDETYAPAKWLTIYDGSGDGDPAFVGPEYAASPQLKGADNRTYPHTYHNDLRISPAIVAEYRQFLEAAEVVPQSTVAARSLEAGVAPTEAAAPRPVLPATGRHTPLAFACAAVAFGLALRKLLYA